MKKTWKRSLCIFMAVLLTALLAACGSSEPDPNSGLYVGQSAEMAGIAVGLDDVFDDEFSIELRDGGKAIFNYDGDSYKLKWTLDGTTFHAEGGGAELDGTLSDGTMVLQNVLDSGIDITLVR